ncbi:MAG: tetratricopeptide repeat protein [Proteobacteria bacterium]|nr:tetratricopeptide repeat protein [Pseudomonadota bacterium]
MATDLAAWFGALVSIPRHNFVSRWPIIACLALAANLAAAQGSKTVIDPTNLELFDGAKALLAGDAKEGVRLTLIGLQRASSASEREAAKSNLCAGYSLLEDYSVALAYCDEVLRGNANHWRTLSNRALIYIRLERYVEADADLLRGEAIAPEARTLLAVRRAWLNATNPVSPIIIIDDRRGSDDELSPDEFSPEDEG